MIISEDFSSTEQIWKKHATIHWEHISVLDDGAITLPELWQRAAEEEKKRYRSYKGMKWGEKYKWERKRRFIDVLKRSGEWNREDGDFLWLFNSTPSHKTNPLLSRLRLRGWIQPHSDAKTGVLSMQWIGSVHFIVRRVALTEKNWSKISHFWAVDAPWDKWDESMSQRETFYRVWRSVCISKNQSLFNFSK